MRAKGEPGTERADHYRREKREAGKGSKSTEEAHNQGEKDFLSGGNYNPPSMSVHADANRDAYLKGRKNARNEIEESEGKAPSLADLDAMLERLDEGIAAEHLAMDRLLQRMVSRIPR